MCSENTCSENVNAGLLIKIGLGCDQILQEDRTIYFYFDCPQKWNTIFNSAIGVKNAVIQAFMMGFTEFVFVKPNREEIKTNIAFWLPKGRRNPRGRSKT